MAAPGDWFPASLDHHSPTTWAFFSTPFMYPPSSLRASILVCCSVYKVLSLLDSPNSYSSLWSQPKCLSLRKTFPDCALISPMTLCSLHSLQWQVYTYLWDFYLCVHLPFQAVGTLQESRGRLLHTWCTVFLHIKYTLKMLMEWVDKGKLKEDIFLSTG